MMQENSALDKKYNLTYIQKEKRYFKIVKIFLSVTFLLYFWSKQL